MPKGEGAESDHAAEKRALLRAVTAVWVLVATGLLVTRCSQPPAVVGADAPDHVFSAERAYQHLESLLGDQTPHPLGSVANDELRSRLLAKLEELGLTPTVNEHWVTGAGTWSTSLMRTRNVLAELPSRHPELPAIMLACHYDSVPSGPGASDDAAAVAALLEVARILQADAPLARPVILLFTDGEELGLHGARAFAQFNPIADRVGMVLNFEARGTSGPSLMFETSLHNRWIVKQLARGLTRPMSSSAYVDVYRRMPNGSDLTVFMQKRLAGMNFAYIGDPKKYHTPLDNLENLDRRSLQHHGDNALGMVRQLLAADWTGADEERGDAVYTDLFARWIIAWPAPLGPWVAGLLLVTACLSFRFLRARRGWRIRSVIGAAACWVLIHLLAVAVAWVGAWLLQRTDPMRSPWPAGMHLDVTVSCLCAAVGVALALLVAKPRPTLFLLVHTFALALGALILAIVLPSFSYLFLLPAVPAVLGSLFLMRIKATDSLRTATCLAVGLVTTVLGVPFLFRLPDALGMMIVAPVLGALMALMLLPLVPLLAPFSRRLFVHTALAVTVLGALVFLLAARTPVFTPDSPQHLGVSFLEVEGDPQAQLAFFSWESPVPSSILEGRPRLDSPHPTYSVPGIPVEAEPAGLSAPQVEILSWETAGGLHRARLRFRRSQPSQQILAGVPAAHGLEEVIAHGKSLMLPPEEADERKWIRLRGVPDEGIELALSWRGPPTLPLAVVGITSGLPAHLAALEAEREALPATPSHMGDETIVVKETVIEEP